MANTISAATFQSNIGQRSTIRSSARSNQTRCAPVSAFLQRIGFLTDQRKSAPVPSAALLRASLFAGHHLRIAWGLIGVGHPITGHSELDPELQVSVSGNAWYGTFSATAWVTHQPLTAIRRTGPVAPVHGIDNVNDGLRMLSKRVRHEASGFDMP